MRRLWISCSQVWRNAVHSLWVTDLTFPQAGSMQVQLGTSKGVFGQVLLNKSAALCTVFFENTREVWLFMHRFHSLNNMYYKKEN